MHFKQWQSDHTQVVGGSLINVLPIVAIFAINSPQSTGAKAAAGRTNVIADDSTFALSLKISSASLASWCSTLLVSEMLDVQLFTMTCQWLCLCWTVLFHHNLVTKCWLLSFNWWILRWWRGSNRRKMIWLLFTGWSRLLLRKGFVRMRFHVDLYNNNCHAHQRALIHWMLITKSSIHDVLCQAGKVPFKSIELLMESS